MSSKKLVLLIIIVTLSAVPLDSKTIHRGHRASHHNSEKTLNVAEEFSESNFDDNIKGSDSVSDSFRPSQKRHSSARRSRHHARPEDERFVSETLEQMLSDQPALDQDSKNTTHDDIQNKANEHSRHLRNKTKGHWTNVIKDTILKRIGRDNSSTSMNDGVAIFNSTMVYPNITVIHNLERDFMETIRSYYPSCEMPTGAEQEAGKDDNTMNLYFHFDHVPDKKGANIEVATLRLYRLPQENVSTTASTESNCENEERLIRISIYWYTKSKKKLKRRLCDSKVVEEAAKWVELSVRPATRAWSKGKNLGLAVTVEDQDGVFLKADKYFKGATCMVGTSTPKSIPTAIVDAINAKLERTNGHFGENSTTTFFDNNSLLPTIDICTIEFLSNYTNKRHFISRHRDACNLKKIQAESQRLLQKEQVERITNGSLHFRHEKHLIEKNSRFQFPDSDPRSRIVGKRLIMTHQEVQNYIQMQNKNFTSNER